MVHSAQHVILSSKDDLVLVTYTAKAPQLFRLSRSPDSPILLTFLHSCYYPSDMEFEGTGASSLGSLSAETEEDQIIVSAAKGQSGPFLFVSS
jgi:hypothetical protein